jgi:predicted Zn-dependent protease
VSSEALSLFRLVSLRYRRVLVALAAGLLVTSCVSERMGLPQVGDGKSVAPQAAPRVTGVDNSSSREHKRLVAMFGGEYHAPAAERMLNEVMVRVARNTEQPDQTYRVTILNSPVVNAFALSTGNLYVTRGLLALANDTSEIAAVMAHEIAHVTLNHAMARAELERRSEMVSRVVAEVLEDPAAGEVVQARNRFSIASFSRQQELEADQVGVRTIAKAGFDPFGAARFLASLGRQSAMRATMLGEKSSQQGMNFLSTHPSTPERVTQALSAARQIGGPGIGESDRQRYLTAIDGIAFGDDPQEGVVRGNRFLHPQLGFTFTAPTGFVLENSAAAVVGVTPGGAQALRFDSVKLPEGQTLATYLESGWIEGVKLGPTETIEVNGLPAVTALGKGDEWTFRMAAVQLGSATYRFILAAKAMTPETDRAFRASVDSFRSLPPDEGANVKPLRIALVTAKPGDTAESLAGKMGPVGDHPFERFQVLNGLDGRNGVKTGSTYKVVVE